MPYINKMRSLFIIVPFERASQCFRNLCANMSWKLQIYTILLKITFLILSCLVFIFNSLNKHDTTIEPTMLPYCQDVTFKMTIKLPTRRHVSTPLICLFDVTLTNQHEARAHVLSYGTSALYDNYGTVLWHCRSPFYEIKNCIKRVQEHCY